MLHNEETDVRLLNRSGIVKVVPGKVIINKKAMASKPIGIRRWSRIDFLTNHCGYILSYDDGAVVEAPKEENKEKVRTTKNAHNKSEQKVKKMKLFK